MHDRPSARRLVLAALVGCALVFPSAARAQSETVTGLAGSMSTGAVITQVGNELNRTIANAQQAGDYLLASAAQKALDAIDAFREANLKVLDKAFSELNQSQRDMFANAHALATQANADIAARIRELDKVGNDLANTVGQTYLTQRRSYVLGQRPYVVPPTMPDTLYLVMSGVNLDVSEPRLELGAPFAEAVGTASGPAAGDAGEGQSALRAVAAPTVIAGSIAGPTRLTFAVPLALLSRDTTRMQVHRVPLRHRTRNGSVFLGMGQKWADVARDVTLITLPAAVGTYTLTAIRTYDARVQSVMSVQGGQITGRRENKRARIGPPAGWQWDLVGAQENDGRFYTTTTGGHQARCQQVVVGESSANSLMYQVRLDNRGGNWPTGERDADVYCRVTGPVFKLERRQEAVAPQTGRLTWTRDVVLDLPADAMNNFKLTFKTFDGREREFTNADVDRFFRVVKTGQGLILSPLVPADIVQ